MKFVHLTGVFSINDAGEIACQGVTKTVELHACLAIPNHSASSIASAGSVKQNQTG